MKKQLLALLFSLPLLALTACSPMNTKSAIALGGEWFLSNQNEDFLHYEYYPKTKVHSNSQHAMREMGAMWSISKLYSFLDDPRYLDLTEKGFTYFENTFTEDPDEGFLYVNITPEKIKLGYNAFAILTLLEIDHPKKDEYLEKLARGIMHMQNPSGELRTFFYSDRDTGKDYYPGEALLAMISLYEVTKNPAHLQTVENALPFYREYFRHNPNTAFAPWQTQAYYKLYELTGNQDAKDFIYDMNDFMIKEYAIGSAACDTLDVDRHGSVVSVHVEGMLRAYALAKKDDNFERKSCYKKFITEGLELTLRLQFTEENTFGIDDYAPEALGGFVSSLTHPERMRVDQNQHSLLALMGLSELGLEF